MQEIFACQKNREIEFVSFPGVKMRLTRGIIKIMREVK